MCLNHHLLCTRFYTVAAHMFLISLSPHRKLCPTSAALTSPTCTPNQVGLKGHRRFDRTKRWQSLTLLLQMSLLRQIQAARSHRPRRPLRWQSLAQILQMRPVHYPGHDQHWQSLMRSPARLNDCSSVHPSPSVRSSGRLLPKAIAASHHNPGNC
jgi:hypothetical protein